MSKILSPKYCQKNKKRQEKKACERYQNLFKEGKEKSDNMVMNVTKNFRKIKTRAC